MPATLKDIAEETGYAVSTVSHVLNGKKSCYASQSAKQAILEAARRLDYRPNYFGRSLSRRRSQLIGVVGGFFGSEVAGQYVRSLVFLLKEHGYTVLFGETCSEAERETEAVLELCDKQVEGLIFSMSSYAGKVREVLPSHIPSLFITGQKIDGAPCVVIDKEKATEQATEHLLKLGHRRIAMLMSSKDSNALKYNGYRKAMERCGALDEALVMDCGKDLGCVRQFVLDHAPVFRGVTAVLASNDLIATAVVSALSMMRVRVPEDCSVVGFDDIQLASMVSPALTTLRQPRDEVGKHATRMLLDLIAGRKVRNVTLVPQWIERESTARCRLG